MSISNLAAALKEAQNMCTLLFASSLAASARTADAPAAAPAAEALGVSHVINDNSLHMMGRVIMVVDTLCLRYHRESKLSAGNDMGQMLAVKETLFRMQSLHLQLVRFCYDTQKAMEYAHKARYLDRWCNEEGKLEHLPFRIELAAQLCDVDTLVHVALHELKDRQSICEHNDRFGKELKAAPARRAYGVRLLRALAERGQMSTPDDEGGSIFDAPKGGSFWHAPFQTYDFIADLETMLQELEAEQNERMGGRSHLSWIARLRKREHCKKLKQCGARQGGTGRGRGEQEGVGPKVLNGWCLPVLLSLSVCLSSLSLSLSLSRSRSRSLSILCFLCAGAFIA
jgi:hypothetical protein